MTHPPNVMPEELQRAHYIMQIVKLEALNAELLAALKDVFTHSHIFTAEAYIQAKTAIAKAEGSAEPYRCHPHE